MKFQLSTLQLYYDYFCSDEGQDASATMLEVLWKKRFDLEIPLDILLNHGNEVAFHEHQSR